ncbi:MAG: hypothetical protein L6Q29_02560 [Candidatus Pacebacteria bacterium]|nr:hypothetical protein [Candidatus Paceibacterota bacterium]NUQ56921.1 hypothetical protein [Candidatus Paceibacter sp.]
MTPEQEEKIRKIFSESRSFAIICGKNSPEETLLAAEAFARLLKNDGGHQYSVIQLPEKDTAFRQKWADILPPDNKSSLIHSSSILIPKDKVDIKEISYSEDEQYVKINISSTKEEVVGENVVFKTMPANVDAVIYFSPRAENKIEESLAAEAAKKIIFPPEEKTIIIAPAAETDTLAGKVYDILLAAGKSGSLPAGRQALRADKNSASLLLASLLTETRFLKKSLGEKTAGILAALLKSGAEQDKISKVFLEKSDNEAKLFGRALARTASDGGRGLVWTFLSEQDLQKTGLIGAGEAVFAGIGGQIFDFYPNVSLAAVLWQKNDSVKCLIRSSSPRERSGAAEKIRLALNCEDKGAYLLCGPYKNFSEAELKIKNALKEVP